MKRSWKGRIFDTLSMTAVKQMVRENPGLREAWQASEILFPDLSGHLPGLKYNEEEELRVRMLVSGQGYFMKGVVEGLREQGRFLNWLDVGDSDGSTRLLTNALVSPRKVASLGVNLQEQAVKNVRSKGLEAEHLDAMDLIKLGRTFDIVSLFETMEHLPDPIGFLHKVRPLVKERLVISVPLIIRSRVSLLYQSPKWDPKKKATVANTHIFELSPKDWIKLFAHTGWAVDRMWSLTQFPRAGVLKCAMKKIWLSRGGATGFWFASLRKDDSVSQKYYIE